MSNVTVLDEQEVKEAFKEFLGSPAGNSGLDHGDILDGDGFDCSLGFSFGYKKAWEKQQKTIEVLEQLRPVWAKGHSSDSVAAQVSYSALTEIWKILGVTNQTEAIQKLEKLVEK